VKGDADAAVKPEAHETKIPDVYYDGINVPSGSMAKAVGPRKLDPTQEPASKFVIVEKTHNANDREAQVEAASRALKLGRYDAAVEMYQKLYDKNPRDPRIVMGLAVAQQNSGMVEQAIQSYQNFLDIKPNDTDATVNMLGLVRQQYPAVALRRLKELADKYPSNAGIAAQIGITEGQEGNFDEALRYLGIAASMQPQNAAHLFNMAIIAEKKGDKAKAVNYYEQALEVDAVYGGGTSVPRDKIYSRLSRLRG
jgi:Flp pilus assembly protein TadD